MEEDTEDVRKIDEILTRHKIELQEQENEEDVYDSVEFINYEEFSDQDENEDEYVFPDFEATDVLKFQSYDLSKMLKDEEKQIVDSCEDPELKSLLQLNRAKNIQLMQFYKKIKDLLVECQENIAAKQDQMVAMKVRKRTFFRVWRLGYPYFKTKDNFPSPRNADGVEKDKYRELLSYQMTPSRKWNQTEMNRLTKGVMFYYKQGRETEMKRKIARLEILMKKEGCKDKILELKELNSEQEDFKKTTDDIALVPADCTKYVDWDRVANTFLRGKYSELECKNMWKLYQDPHVSKQAWTHEEQLKLMELAEKYNQQDWETIASELGTEKSSLLVCTHYFSDLTTPLKKKFTSEEDEFLLNMVEKYKTGSFIPWAKIAHHFVDKDRQQLYYRYRYHLSLRDKQSATKNKFTEAEDVLIMLLVDKFGRRFSMFENYFPDRAMMQLKARYATNLRYAVKKGAFTVEEDIQIINHVQLCGESNWMPLTKTMKRYGAQLRQRYKVLQMYLLQNPEKTVKDAPRKICSSVNYPELIGGYRFEFLRAIADRYQHSKKIPSLDEINELLSNFVNESDLDKDEDSLSPIDNLLTDFFVEQKKNQLNDLTPDETFTYATQVQNVLNTFQATLEIPHNYYDIFNLDEFDKKILDIISSKGLNYQKKWVIPSKLLPESELGYLLPPNVENLTALRKLITETLDLPTEDECLPRKSYDTTVLESLAKVLKEYSQEETTKKVKWCIDNYLKNLDETTEENIKSERTTFNRRFLSMFKYPMIMNTFQPNEAISKEEKVDHTTKIYSRKKLLNINETEDKDKSSKKTTEDDPVIKQSLASANMRCYVKKKKTPKENCDFIKQEIIETTQVIEKPDENQSQAETGNEETAGRHMVWITTPNKLFDMENDCAPSTSFDNDVNIDYPHLTMAERLKLKIQNQLLDLDRKNDKMPINKNWVYNQCNTKSSDSSEQPPMPYFAKGMGRLGRSKGIYTRRKKHSVNKNPPVEAVPVGAEPLEAEKAQAEKIRIIKRKNNTQIESTSELDKNETKTKEKNDKNQINPTKKRKIEDNKIQKKSDKARKQVKRKRNAKKYVEDSSTSEEESSSSEEENLSLLDRLGKMNTKNLRTYSSKNQTKRQKIKQENIKQNERNIHYIKDLLKSNATKRTKPKENYKSSNIKIPKIKEEILEECEQETLHLQKEDLIIENDENTKNLKTNITKNQIKIPKIKEENPPKTLKPKEIPKIKQEIIEESEHATFDLQKGELIIESDENSDLEDLKALNQALKKVKQEVELKESKENREEKSDESPAQVEFDNEEKNTGGHKIWVTTPNKLFGVEDKPVPSTSFENIIEPHESHLSTAEKLKLKIQNDIQNLGKKNKKETMRINENWIFNKSNKSSSDVKTKTVTKKPRNKNFQSHVEKKVKPLKVGKFQSKKKRNNKK